MLWSETVASLDMSTKSAWSLLPVGHGKNKTSKEMRSVEIFFDMPSGYIGLIGRPTDGWITCPSWSVDVCRENKGDVAAQMTGTDPTRASENGLVDIKKSWQQLINCLSYKWHQDKSSLSWVSPVHFHSRWIFITEVWFLKKYSWKADTCVVLLIGGAYV